MTEQTGNASGNSDRRASGPQVGLDAVVVPLVLLDFCDAENEKLANPWSWDGWSCASDGRIAVRIPHVAGLDREPPFDSAKTLRWDPKNDGEWVDIPQYVLPEKRDCKACHGTGKVDFCPECEGEGIVEFSNSFNFYTVDCGSCGGEGTVFGNKINCRSCSGKGFVFAEEHCPVVFGTGDVDISAFLLEKIKDFPGIKIFTAPTDTMFHIKFDGGDGIVMGMLR